MDYLLQNGADPNATAKDGGTPLFIACQHGFLSITKKLLESGYAKTLSLFVISVVLILLRLVGFQG